jgi:hypothetical protein
MNGAQQHSWQHGIPTEALKPTVCGRTGRIRMNFSVLKRGKSSLEELFFPTNFFQRIPQLSVQVWTRSITFFFLLPAVPPRI